MTHKTEELYWHAFYQLVVISNWKINVHSYTRYFKRAIINSELQKFPEGFRIGCLFHLKQAWRRYLISKLGFVSGKIVFLMSVGVLGMLCIIPKDEVEEYGIPYVRSIIEEDLDDM